MKKLTATEVRRYEGQLRKLPQGAVVWRNVNAYLRSLS